ncbi:hypothetical protein EC973_008064 [Apophysomyces ossiformis]|uniref:Uncharacterized protein n=1 Tax=Apophysomyces ossiformis TaxID=679940 RepID=A0A8H7ETX6_9FUNG|nr:hypothetical protein EC973_008064 [Apophysomyces ossiformis]
MAYLSSALPLDTPHSNTAFDSVISELDQTVTSTPTTTPATSLPSSPINALAKEVESLETQLNNNTPLDQIRTQWTSFTQQFVDQSPKTAEYINAMNEIISRFSSAEEWKHLAEALKTRVENNQPIPTSTQAAHQNQATW